MFKKFGIQLYTVRETMKDAESIRATFKALKEMGYEGDVSIEAATQDIEKDGAVSFLQKMDIPVDVEACCTFFTEYHHHTT